MKIWSANYVLHFGSVKTHKDFLYWSVFSSDINGKIVFNCLLHFKPFFLVRKLWLKSVNSTTFFWHAQKLRLGVYLRDFSIVIYEKFNSDFSVYSLAFFTWPVNCSSHFLVPLCLSLNCLSWALDFRDVQKIKHELIFESLRVLLFIKSSICAICTYSDIFLVWNCTILVCKLWLLYQTMASVDIGDCYLGY